MAYRRRRREEENPVAGFLVGIVLLYLIYIGYLYNADRAAYWRQLGYFMIFGIVVIAAYFIWRELSYRWHEKRLDDLLAGLRQNGLEEYVINFIDRFGSQKGKKTDWNYRGHYFDWDRLKDFRKVLNERGMHLNVEKWDQVSLLLHHYIQEREERLTRESVGIFPQKFATLSGSDFESLLYRLFGAMGYSVQKTGQVGDQGCDLVVNMGSERVAVQAKRYTESVPNAAVQQVVAAQKMYGCNKGMVVTNSSFTKEAVDLAKNNNIDLIDGKKLSELLMQHLKESWS